MEHLQRRAGTLLSAGIAKNTQLAYETGLKAFMAFRSKYSMSLSWPATQQQILLFIAYCFELDRAPSTILTYLAGINYYHKLHGWQDFQNSFIIQKTLEGCKRKPRDKDARAPISIQILCEICKVLPAVCYNRSESCLFHALYTMAYFGLFRISELVSTNGSLPLMATDVKLIEDKLHITLRHSKTNQRSIPVIIKLPREPNVTVCPVQAFANYLEFQVPGGLLFRHADGSPVTRQQFSGVLAKCIHKTKFAAGHYRSHSFRIGRATDLAMQGLQNEQIMILGRWRSDCFKSYIRY